MRCAVCGGEAHEVVLDLGDRRLLRCKQCGVRFLDPIPDFKELEKEYSEGYAPFALASRSPGPVTRFRRDWYTARRRRWIRGLQFKSVLDVGCGTGEFLLKLRQSGVDVHGLEPSEFAARFAASQGLDVFQGSVADYRPGRTFDLITLWNVVEHLTEPAGDLARLRALLAPGGTIAILTPDAGSPQAARFGLDWAGLEVPKHLHLFDSASLETLAGKAGLSQSGRLPARVDHFYIGLASWASARRRRGFSKAFRLVPAAFSGEDSMLVVWLRHT